MEVKRGLYKNEDIRRLEAFEIDVEAYDKSTGD